MGGRLDLKTMYSHQQPTHKGENIWTSCWCVYTQNRHRPNWIEFL